MVTQLINEEDKVIYRKKQSCDLKQILQGLEPFKDCIEGIAVESTYNRYWLVDGLMETGYRVHLVNTAAVKQYEGLKEYRQRLRCFLAGAFVTFRPITNGIYLSKAKAGCQGFITQAGVVSQATNRTYFEYRKLICS